MELVSLVSIVSSRFSLYVLSLENNMENNFETIESNCVERSRLRKEVLGPFPGINDYRGRIDNE